MGLKDIFSHKSKRSSGGSAAEPDSPPGRTTERNVGSSPPSLRTSRYIDTNAASPPQTGQPHSASSGPKVSDVEFPAPPSGVRPGTALTTDTAQAYLPPQPPQASNFSSEFQQFGLRSSSQASSEMDPRDDTYAKPSTYRRSEDIGYRNAQGQSRTINAHPVVTGHHALLGEGALPADPAARQSSEGRRSTDHSYAPKSKLQALLPRPPLQEVPVYGEAHPDFTHQELSTPHARSSQRAPAVPAHRTISPQQSAATHALLAHESSYPPPAAVPPPVPAHRTLDDSRRSSIPRKSVGDEGVASRQGIGAYSDTHGAAEARIGTNPINTAQNRSYDRATDLEKELPMAPAIGTGARNRDIHTAKGSASVTGHRTRPKQRTIGEQPYIVEGATEPPSLEGIVDLTDTVDTTIDERYAPAVIHEHVHLERTEIVQEELTREIHNYHYHHRVLPIIDVEVLPPRHFIPVINDGTTGFVEVSPEQLPARVRNGYAKNWVIAETASMLPSGSEPAVAPRQFTARKFQGTEGDYKEWVDEKGAKKTESWWVHPPEISRWAEKAGETVPMHFGLPDSEPVLGAVAPFPKLVLADETTDPARNQILSEGRAGESVQSKRALGSVPLTKPVEESGSWFSSDDQSSGRRVGAADRYAL